MKIILRATCASANLNLKQAWKAFRLEEFGSNLGLIHSHKGYIWMYKLPVTTGDTRCKS